MARQQLVKRTHILAYNPVVGAQSDSVFSIERQMSQRVLEQFADVRVRGDQTHRRLADI